MKFSILDAAAVKMLNPLRGIIKKWTENNDVNINLDNSKHISQIQNKMLSWSLCKPQLID